MISILFELEEGVMVTLKPVISTSVLVAVVEN